MKQIDKLAWIEIQDQRILSTRSYSKAVYYIPGGKREAGESDAEALIREIKEELNVELIPESLSFMENFTEQAHGHAAGIGVKMQCYTGRYTGIITPTSEIEEVTWLTFADRSSVSAVDQIIFDWLKERQMIK